MKLRNICAATLLAVVLAGCGTAATTTPEGTPTGMTEGEGTATSPVMQSTTTGSAFGVATITPEGASTQTGPQATVTRPVQAIQDFLTALQNDPSGQSSVQYLSKRLQDEVRQGKSVPMLLGIQNTYPSFSTKAIEAGSGAGNAANTATVRASLDFVNPEDRVFTLINENNSWQIDKIEAP